MKSQSFTTTILVDKSPNDVFKAVTNPRGWWSEEIVGGTEKLNDEFDYHFKDVHRSKMRLVEVVPDQKVVWLVVENWFQFTKDKNEWTGDRVIFDISKKGDKTQLILTQDGLTPENECYSVCENAWTNYIHNSLKKLILTGKGEPIKKEVGNEFENSIRERASGE